MSEALDDHLPPPPPEGAAAPSRRSARDADRVVVWGDRALFLAVGLLLGFAGAWVLLDKGPVGPTPADPHAGVAGAPPLSPGAVRDLPDGAGAAAAAPNPAAGLKSRQALDDLQALAAKDPKNRDLLVRLGNAAFDADDPATAISAYERALALNRKDANVLTDLGVSYRNAGRYDDALRLFDEALRVEPAHWQAAFNKVIVHGLDKGDTATAQKILAKLKADHPEIPALDRLGEELARRGGGSR